MNNSTQQQYIRELETLIIKELIPVCERQKPVNYSKFPLQLLRKMPQNATIPALLKPRCDDTE